MISKRSPFWRTASDLLGVGFQHHGRHHVAVVGVVGQRVVDRVFQFLGVGGQVDEALGAAVDLRFS
jgi:hypothetical protein